ncbi:MAG: NAD-dependent epimerase/dehydratase family protein [Planctomycetaceae bacterium]|nr:NAD-dependent epimerase/dehydratase family protein [Planctomycetaceae bacterium]
MKKVFVTGASGFIGYHLIRKLRSRNIEVRCLIRSTSEVSHLAAFNAEYCTGDLTSPDRLAEAVAGCDTVFHLAGLVRARKYAEFESVNRDGTRNLAQAAAECPAPPVFVYVSSLAAAGFAAPNNPKRETDSPMPVSGYGKSKLAGENALLPFAGRLPCTVIRPGIVFGGRDKMGVELFKAVKRLGFCPNPGWTAKYYSWVHAEDLAELLTAAAERGERLAQGAPAGTGIYFASGGAGQRFSDICKMIGESLHRRVRPFLIPPAAVWGVAMYYEMRQRLIGCSQPFDWDKAGESLRHWCCSPKKAETQLNFSPLPLQERFRQTVQWFQENGWL